VSTLREINVGTITQADALLAELVGEEGEITTVDIDPDVVDSARRCLTAAACTQVNIVLADAEDGVPDHAPYDRVIVTAGTWDIPLPGPTNSPKAGGSLTTGLPLVGLPLVTARIQCIEHRSDTDGAPWKLRRVCSAS
jgi:protein-L-isoaspartate(D-aspartate) O-methyltransferase